MERQITTKASRGNSTPAAKQSRSVRAPAHPILGLQQTIGNQAVQRLLQSPQFQAKFTISQPGDKYEQEADRVADTVMRMPEPVLPEKEKTPVQMKPLAAQISPLVQRATEPVPEEKPEEVVAAPSLLQRVPVAVREDDEEKVQTKPLLSADSAIQRLCTECEEEKVQTKEAAGQTSALAPPAEAQISNLQSSGGELLAESVRSFFEPRFGQDFSQVRIHQGSQAAASARAVNARAYTMGRNIAFGAGEYAPETTEGKRLLAHELTHVVQQKGDGVGAWGGTVHLQRTIGDGHDLASSRFKGDSDLEGCYDDEARLTLNGIGKLGTRKIQSGPAVKKVQEALIELGYLKEGSADGNYTQATWDAVKALKRDKSLGSENMGDVGTGTVNWLDQNFLSGNGCPPCPSSDPRPSPCLPCPPILPEPPNPDVPPGPKIPDDSPPEFCVPFLTKQEAFMAHPFVVAAVMAFTAKFGPEIQNLWIKYLLNPKSGTKGTLPPRQIFGDQQSRVVKEFRQDPETHKQRNRIMQLLAERVRSNPSLMPLPGQSTQFLNFRDVLKDSELLDLPMSFGDPGNKIPGLIAGGPGKNASDAGDDVRNVDGKFIATNLGASTLHIRAAFVFDVFDCVDFCPGASGSGFALGLTIPMSKLEATPDVPTYDVPFEVIYGLSDDQSF